MYESSRQMRVPMLLQELSKRYQICVQFLSISFSKMVDPTVMEDCSVCIPVTRRAAELKCIWMADAFSKCECECD
jgi:hypothetical protein